MMLATNQIFNGIYLLNPEISTQTLTDAIKARLCKAEALALLAASSDLELYKTDTINNYLWTLSDLLIEVNALYSIANH